MGWLSVSTYHGVSPRFDGKCENIERRVSMSSHVLLNLLSVILAIVAVVATVVGAFMGFDKSLWPLDGRILYVGHLAHVLVIPVSATIFIRGCKANPRSHAGWLFIQGAIFVSALVTVMLIYQGMFNYGWWPS